MVCKWRPNGLLKDHFIQPYWWKIFSIYTALLKSQFFLRSESGHEFKLFLRKKIRPMIGSPSWRILIRSLVFGGKELELMSWLQISEKTAFRAYYNIDILHKVYLLWIWENRLYTTYNSNYLLEFCHIYNILYYAHTGCWFNRYILHTYTR